MYSPLLAFIIGGKAVTFPLRHLLNFILIAGIIVLSALIIPENKSTDNTLMGLLCGFSSLFGIMFVLGIGGAGKRA